MASISLKGIYKIYPGDVTAVSDFNLEIEDKEFIILVGPSGCGKSTTLRMIAGLEEISKGELYIGDRLVNDVPPKDRDIAMVFQNYALYPHMTVYKNMAFGLELRKTPKDEIDKRVREAARVLDIEHLLDRKPKALSGGQRQRVALGRAMVRNPAVFLLDEPLSNLDAKLRGQMRNEIRRLQKKLGLTVIYVTHDQVEAMTMGDHILVLHGGKIQQMGTPLELYNQPANTFVAGFIGSPQMNLAKAQLTEKGLVLNNDLVVPLTQEERAHLPQGSQWQIGVRAEQIEPASPGEEGTCLVYTQSTEMMGNETQVLFNVGETLFTARWTGQYIIDAGQHLNVTLSADDFHFFDGEKGTLIRPALHIKGFTAQTA